VFSSSLAYHDQTGRCRSDPWREPNVRVGDDPPETRNLTSISNGGLKSGPVAPIVTADPDSVPARSYRREGNALSVRRRSHHMLQILSAKDKAEHVLDDFLKHFR
jgi:hypothetical protein